jgi:hypothetical protein
MTGHDWISTLYHDHCIHDWICLLYQTVINMTGYTLLDPHNMTGYTLSWPSPPGNHPRIQCILRTPEIRPEWLIFGCPSARRGRFILWRPGFPREGILLLIKFIQQLFLVYTWVIAAAENRTLVRSRQKFLHFPEPVPSSIPCIVCDSQLLSKCCLSVVQVLTIECPSVVQVLSKCCLSVVWV